MRTKIGLFSIFSLILLMIIPVHADVTSLSLEKSFYTIDEDFKIIGTQEGKEIVYVIIRDQGGNYRGMVSDPTTTQGEFDAIPRAVSLFFDNKGIYNATAFTDSQKEVNGTSILLEFDGKKVFEIPSFVLELKGISDKTVEVEKTITFTAVLIDSSIKDSIFSLNNEPTGATIDSKTGKFVWTPSKSHGNIQDVHYNFEVIVKKGSQEDKEKVTITVKQAYVEPEPKPKPTKTEPEPEKTVELGLAAFVDTAKDPQSYVDRYNNEANYKKWFDENYSQYDSIYQAVGLDEPLLIPAPFVDTAKDPQSYVDRYNNEANYKKWFDENYSQYDSIYQAVGLD
ncbi:MAG: putative Ig domain-containing protein, partial [Candidatus Nitrosopumilus sp. bin_6a]